MLQTLHASIVVSAGLLLAVSTSARAMTYYTRPDGDDANPGTRNTPNEAWRSIDRGQPTVLAKPAKTGDTTVYLAKASQFPPQGKVRLGEMEVSYTGRAVVYLTFEDTSVEKAKHLLARTFAGVHGNPGIGRSPECVEVRNPGAPAKDD